MGARFNRKNHTGRAGLLAELFRAAAQFFQSVPSIGDFELGKNLRLFRADHDRVLPLMRVNAYSQGVGRQLRHFVRRAIIHGG